MKLQKAFTLVETILACVILCASILAIGAVSTRSLSSLKLNRHYETAATLAEKQLIMIDYIGVEECINSNMTEGDFELTEPPYHWQLSVEKIDIGNLYEVKVTITWTEQNLHYDVSVSTRLNGTGNLSEITEL